MCLSYCGFLIYTFLDLHSQYFWSIYLQKCPTLELAGFWPVARQMVIIWWHYWRFYSLLCVFNRSITGNTHQIKFLLLLLSLTDLDPRLCSGLLTTYQVFSVCRLGSDLSTLLHTSHQDHITPSQSENPARGPWENWDESEVLGPTFRQTYQQQQ